MIPSPTPCSVRARANGTKLARPRINGDLEAAVRAALAQGAGIQRTAKLIGVGVGTVQRIKQTLTPSAG
jgi:hypothetical protein